MKYKMRIAVVALAMVTSLSSIWHVMAQTGQNGNGNGRGRSESVFNNISPGTQTYLRALGRRGKEVGKEKTIYTGQLFDKQGRSNSVRIIHQLPNLVRLEGFKSDNSAISFDGQRGYGAANRKEESYLEAFTTDMLEGMLNSIQHSAAIRFLGSGFGPDPKRVPNYTGPRFDIIDVLDIVRCKRNTVKRIKSYYLYTKTGFLESTRYKDGTVNPAVTVETRFSTWGTIDGSAYPARIDRYEGGELQFTFIAEQITAESSTNVEDYR